MLKFQNSKMEFRWIKPVLNAFRIRWWFIFALSTISHEFDQRCVLCIINLFDQLIVNCDGQPTRVLLNHLKNRILKCLNSNVCVIVTIMQFINFVKFVNWNYGVWYTCMNRVLRKLTSKQMYFLFLSLCVCSIIKPSDLRSKRKDDLKLFAYLMFFFCSE